MAYSLTGIFALTACESDRDDNPTIAQSTTLQLNTISLKVDDLEGNITIQSRCVSHVYY